MPAPTYRQMWPVYASFWDSMGPARGREAEIARAAKALFAAKDRYVGVEGKTGVPWIMVAVLHWRESAQSWQKQLGQGWPLNSKSRWIPYTGPFATWEESAYDALVVQKGYNKVVEWRLEKMLYYQERWNGWGYWQYHGKMPSPFLWGASTIQKRGKYVSDGSYDPFHWDTQLGTAILMSAIASFDKTVKFVRED